MDFSLSTYCLFQTDVVETLETLTKHTAYVELMYEASHSVADAKMLREYPLTYSVHSPFMGMNLSSFDEKQRERTVRSINKSISLAAEIEAEVVVIHPGAYQEEKDRSKAVDRMEDSLAVIKKHAGNCGVSLALENMGNWTDWGINILQNPEEIRNDMGFCLDIGHSNLCGNLPKFLEKPFSHIHIHNNNGKTDEHAAVQAGTIDISSVIEAIRKNKIAHPVIECSTLDQALSSLEYLRKLRK